MSSNDSLNKIFHVHFCTSSIPGEEKKLPVYLSTMPSKTSASNVTWNADIVHALGLYKMVNQILGIWPLNCQDVFSKARLVVVAILQISMTINLVRELQSDCMEAEQMVIFLGLTMVSIIALIKIIVLRLNQKRMKLLINTAVEDWSKVENTEARMVMKSHASTGRFVFIFQMSSAYATILSLILGSLPFDDNETIANSIERNVNNFTNFNASQPPIFLATTLQNSQRSLPMGTICFIPNSSPIFYGFIYVLQIIQLSTTAAGNIGTDVFFFAVALHVCGQFELLKNGFKSFGQEPDDIDKCRIELKELIERHNQLINLSNKFEETFNFLILGQLCLNAFYMNLLGIRALISLKEGDSVTVVGSLISIYVLCLQLFLYSYAGDYLTTQIEKLRDAVYCCRWYDLPSTIIRDLIFVMSRSNVDFCLTAGKVYRMNLDNFKNILKAVASYFSMLRIVFEA